LHTITAHSKDIIGKLLCLKSQNKEFSTFVKKIISLLSHLACEKEFFPTFADHKKRLIVNVILPLLKTTEEEEEKIIENP
jgi:hypothetical protein